MAREPWECDRKRNEKNEKAKRVATEGIGVCARRQRATKAGRHRGIDRMNATRRTRYSASNLDDQTSDSSLTAALKDEDVCIGLIEEFFFF